eukprot:Skav205790  [mRNA]  locus=scaffold340:276883:277092:+ [translate_table: standard]
MRCPLWAARYWDPPCPGGSGSIEAAEFIAPLSRWVHESKTAPRFIKYNMLRSALEPPLERMVDEWLVDG